MLMAAALALLSASGQVTFTGAGVATYPPIEITPDANPNMKIYVLWNTQGVSMHYASETGERAQVCTFESYPNEIGGVQWNGYETTLNQVIKNTGYIINDTFYCWVVNYADYEMFLNSISWVDDNPCDMLKLKVDGIAPKIPYKYKINGSTMLLDRELKLSYKTQVWDDVNKEWKDETVVETFESLENGSIVIDPPLCNTDFVLTGDYFLKEWGIPEKKVETVDHYYAKAVRCVTDTITFPRDNRNEKDRDSSAPIHVIFTGYPTYAVEYRVWEIATDADFENVILQFNQDELDYTFSETGNYYVRYRVANADGSCEYIDDNIYAINVTESELKCPNAFSPANHDEVNDIWKVSYKSLVEFHCWIFNRWGTLLYEFTDPGGGWDGTYRGKLVDTGVYYYVITALGSDGVKYEKRGDINILHYKGGISGTDNGTDMNGGY